MEVWMHYLERAAREGASDVFLVPGAPVSYKLEGRLQPMGEARVMPDQSKTYIEEIYRLAERDISDFLTSGDDDFSFSVPGLARFRVNVYRQRGSWAAVIRVVQFSVPDYKELGIPEQVMALAWFWYPALPAAASLPPLLASSTGSTGIAPAIL